MVAPAVIMAAAQAAPKVISAVKGLGSKLGGALSSLKSSPIGSWVSGKMGALGSGGGLDALIGRGSDSISNAQFNAYAQAIADSQKSDLEKRAEKYDQKLQNQFNEAEPQYQQEANTQLPELEQLVSDIANQSAEAQRQNQKQINASLAQQGVRGGQAAILANRATGELNRDLQRDINQSVYNEAANRQNSRLNYYSQKALTPWSAMSNAYGNSMVGANNALSGAQGDVYKNAYTAMLNKRGGTQMGNQLVK